MAGDRRFYSPWSLGRCVGSTRQESFCTLCCRWTLSRILAHLKDNKKFSRIPSEFPEVLFTISSCSHELVEHCTHLVVGRHDSRPGFSAFGTVLRTPSFILRQYLFQFDCCFGGKLICVPLSGLVSTRDRRDWYRLVSEKVTLGSNKWVSMSFSFKWVTRAFQDLKFQLVFNHERRFHQ